MNRLGLAWYTFMEILSNKRFADKVTDAILEDFGGAPQKEATKAKPRAAPEKPAPAPSAPPPQPAQSRDALSLISLFQREGRLVDFLKEPLDAYSDDQIGAAVRDIHRNCSGVLERVFSPKPVSGKPEGESMELSSGFNAEEYRLVGEVGGTAAASGTIKHTGWRATKYEVPQWSGSPNAQQIIAPAEVEVLK